VNPFPASITLFPASWPPAFCPILRGPLGWRAAATKATSHGFPWNSTCNSFGFGTRSTSPQSEVARRRLVNPVNAGSAN
jgi:hypothetical protein